MSMFLDNVRGASAAFLTSTVREVQPVDRVEDVALDPAHPLVREAERLVRERIAEELAASAPA